MKSGLILILTITMTTLSFFASKDSFKNQPEWDSLSVGQTGLLIRGSQDAISYAEDGSVMWSRNVIGQCTYGTEEKEKSRVYVSPVSPKRSLFVVLCWENLRGGKAAWIVDNRNRTVLAKNIVPKDWGIAAWVSWSPNEDYALFHAVGEVTMVDMVFVNLVSGNSEAIRFKKFARTDSSELQDFNRDALVWADTKSFRLNIDVRCNPYELGEEQCKREDILHSHSVRVNLAPSRISYGFKRNQPTESQETPSLENYVDRDLNDLLREVPGIERRLKVLLGTNYNLFMTNLTVSAALESKEGYLYMHGIAPHMGTVEEAIFLISLANKKIHCAILSRRFGRKYKVFSEDPSSVPTVLLDQSLYR